MKPGRWLGHHGGEEMPGSDWTCSVWEQQGPQNKAPAMLAGGWTALASRVAEDGEGAGMGSWGGEWYEKEWA